MYLTHSSASSALSSLMPPKSSAAFRMKLCPRKADIIQKRCEATAFDSITCAHMRSSNRTKSASNTPWFCTTSENAPMYRPPQMSATHKHATSFLSSMLHELQALLKGSPKWNLTKTWCIVMHVGYQGPPIRARGLKHVQQHTFLDKGLRRQCNRIHT